MEWFLKNMWHLNEISISNIKSLSYDLVEVMYSVEAPSLSACVCLCSVTGAAAYRSAPQQIRL